MAGKKRKKQRNRQRQSFAPAAARPVPDATGEGPQTASPLAAPPSSAPQAGAGRSPATPSSGSGISGPRRPLTPAAAGTIDIDARVPYFTSDLRRVLITAAVMIALIVVGSLLIH